MERFAGFAPVWFENSRVLILGSFPSVMSRKVGFYYGNPQNRFWRTVCGFFGEEIPPDVAGKTAFLKRRGLALWDVVEDCEIVGSADSSIRNESVADVAALVEKSNVEAVFCNGGKSYAVLEKQFPQLLSITTKLPSTSPANPRYTYAAWEAALQKIFPQR